MRNGMLWWCGDKYVLAEQVERACRRYTEKYGRNATMVYANPATLEGFTGAVGVELRAARSILVNHLWVGESEADRPRF